MRRPRRCLCFLLVLSISTTWVMGMDTFITNDTSSVKDTSVIASSKKLNAVGTPMHLEMPYNVSLVQQPTKEIQQVKFQNQPKLFLFLGNESTYVHTNQTYLPYQVNATLKHSTQGMSNQSTILLGSTSINFVNRWANFTDLSVSRFGHGYILEFIVYHYETDSLLFNISSAPFDVVEIPFNVYIDRIAFAPLSEKTFAVTVNLSLWDYMRNTLAQLDKLNVSEWRYNISLQYGGFLTDNLTGETSGRFPPGKNRTPLIPLNLTSTGYNLQFNVTVSSPQLTSRIENLSAPFDALRPWSNKVQGLENATVTLAFNLSIEDNSESKEQFLTIFRNYFGQLYGDVRWLDPKMEKTEKGIIVTVRLFGRTKELEDIKLKLWEKVKTSHPMPFHEQMVTLQQSMSVNGVPYYGSDGPPNSSVLSPSQIVTIVLMSFLCASFLIAVMLWRVREKRVMESYNRRMRARKRQNGHVNTAFDSNESVQARHEVYLITMSERAKARACSETDPLRRCSSGGLPRSYRRANNSRLGSDDEDTWPAGSGAPLDDDMVFADCERHDEAFNDHYYSSSRPRWPTMNSSLASFHEDFLMRDVPGPSSRSVHKYGRRKCSVTASTPTGSVSSLPNSRSASRILASAASDNTYSLVRPPMGWSSHDDKRMCNGRSLVEASSAIC